jgi:hypothetical protein
MLLSETPCLSLLVHSMVQVQKTNVHGGMRANSVQHDFHYVVLLCAAEGCLNYRTFCRGSACSGFLAYRICKASLVLEC